MISDIYIYITFYFPFFFCTNTNRTIRINITDIAILLSMCVYATNLHLQILPTRTNLFICYRFFVTFPTLIHSLTAVMYIFAFWGQNDFLRKRKKYFVSERTLCFWCIVRVRQM